MIYRTSATKLPAGHIQVTPDMLEKAAWLLKKYTSVAYLRRMYALYANFLSGYESYVKTQTIELGFYRETLATLFLYQGHLERGIELISRGHHAGYSSVRDGLWFADYLTGRRFENGLMHEPIGFRWNGAAVGLYAWLKRSVRMAARVELTLRNQWAFPRILDPFFEPFGFPARISTSSMAGATNVKPQGEIPVSGIWQPVDVKSGCPAYLVAGSEAPTAMVATSRYDRPAIPATEWTPAAPPKVTYEYGPVPSSWSLVWQDERYQGGRVEEESAYLDPSTEAPPWPPVVESPP